MLIAFEKPGKKNHKESRGENKFFFRRTRRKTWPPRAYACVRYRHGRGELGGGGVRFSALRRRRNPSTRSLRARSENGRRRRGRFEGEESLGRVPGGARLDVARTRKRTEKNTRKKKNYRAVGMPPTRS